MEKSQILLGLMIVLSLIGAISLGNAFISALQGQPSWLIPEDNFTYSVDLEEITISNYQLNRESNDYTYSRFEVRLNNTGNTDLILRNFNFSLCGWQLEPSYFYILKNKQRTFEFEYKNKQCVDDLLPSTQWDLEFNFNNRLILKMSNEFKLIKWIE